MSNVKDYVIPLNGVSPEDLTALKKLFETHSQLFNAAILSTYGEDIRYAVTDGTFGVTELSDRQVQYICQVNYFAPCNDKNEFFHVQGNADYAVVGENIILKLDETVWNVG